MPKIFSEKFLERMRSEKSRGASGKGKKTVDPLRQSSKANTSRKETKIATVKRGNKARIQKKGTKPVFVGACEVSEKCDCLVQDGGKPSGHVGCTEVDRALVALGVNPTNANLCTKAAIMRGHIKITGQAGDLEQKIVKEKGECGHMISATLGELLKQSDFPGIDYGEDCGNVSVTCKECHYELERTYVVSICEGNFSLESKFDPGEFFSSVHL